MVAQVDGIDRNIGKLSRERLAAGYKELKDDVIKGGFVAKRNKMRAEPFSARDIWKINHDIGFVELSLYELTQELKKQNIQYSDGVGKIGKFVLQHRWNFMQVTQMLGFGRAGKNIMFNAIVPHIGAIRIGIRQVNLGDNGARPTWEAITVGSEYINGYGLSNGAASAGLTLFEGIAQRAGNIKMVIMNMDYLAPLIRLGNFDRGLAYRIMEADLSDLSDSAVTIEGCTEGRTISLYGHQLDSNAIYVWVECPGYVLTPWGVAQSTKLQAPTVAAVLLKFSLDGKFMGLAERKIKMAHYKEGLTAQGRDKRADKLDKSLNRTYLDWTI